MRYEYRVEKIQDNKYGEIEVESLQNRLERYASNGWRLVTAFTNELGKETSSGGYGGISIGTNSTHEETVLIFERPIMAEELSIKRYENTKYHFKYAVYVSECLIQRNCETNEVLLQLKGVVENDIVPEILFVDIFIEDCFGKQIKIDNMLFDNIIIDRYHSFTTEKERIDAQNVRAIRTVKMLVNSFYCDGKIIDIDYSNESLPPNENIDLDMENVIKKIESFGNAKEIFDYVNLLREQQQDLIDEKLMVELSNVYTIERMYGNQKHLAVKKIREYYHIG